MCDERHQCSMMILHAKWLNMEMRSYNWATEDADAIVFSMQVKQFQFNF